MLIFCNHVCFCEKGKLYIISLYLSKITPSFILTQVLCCHNWYNSPWWVLTLVWFVKDSSRLTCDLCSSSLKNRKNLLEHIKIHMHRQEGRRFPCLECGKVFTLKNGLKAHMRFTHSAALSNPQKCPKCRKFYKNVWRLQYHFQRYHS